MVKKESGHNVGKSHLKHRGKGDHVYDRKEEDEPGMNSDVPRGMRHGPRDTDKK